LPHQNDHSDEASILPQPDLNPLLNPLLGQNMGRWAEVYFTSAPEKREQALQDLLRELQAEHDAREAAVPAPVAEVTENSPGMQSALVRCPACGRENPATHRFCGMCGTAVLERGAVNDPRMADRHTTDFIVADLDAASLDSDSLDSADLDSADLNPADLNLNAVNVATEDRHSKSPRRDEPVLHEPAWREPAPPAPGTVESNRSRFATFENAPFESPMRANESLQSSRGREDAYHADHMGGLLDPEPASSSYRVPLVITLAVVLLTLGYITWRSMQAADSSNVAQSAVSAPVPPAPSTTETPKIDTPDGASPAANQPGGPSNLAPASEATNSTSDSTSKAASPKAANSRAAQTTLIPKQKAQAETVSESGGEELATAQRYLSGTTGQERDSAEAAKWLWKAIAKHNGEASLLLSDLYLKGDGVGKNCDQARVLLDAAAVRGVPGAAERLRHLQAFGCS
jgi:hypothetical protein